MLYTRKGDAGTTKVFNSPPGVRISKSSCQTEALGAMDELNSFLGLCKVNEKAGSFNLLAVSFSEIIGNVQQSLFIIQAELAGAEKSITDTKVKEIELLTDTAEKELPPIKTFFISGGTELAALLDISRTLARKAERRVIGHIEKGGSVGVHTLAYLNRLSSLMYALARFANHKSGIVEQSPNYK